MGGVAGRDGDQNGPPIMLKFMYSNKKNVLLSNLALMSTAIRSKVISNLSLKIWNFKADFRIGNQLKIMMVTQKTSPRVAN